MLEIIAADCDVEVAEVAGQQGSNAILLVGGGRSGWSLDSMSMVPVLGLARSNLDPLTISIFVVNDGGSGTTSQQTSVSSTISMT